MPGDGQASAGCPGSLWPAAATRPHGRVRQGFCSMHLSCLQGGFFTPLLPPVLAEQGGKAGACTFPKCASLTYSPRPLALSAPADNETSRSRSPSAGACREHSCRCSSRSCRTHDLHNVRRQNRARGRDQGHSSRGEGLPDALGGVLPRGRIADRQKTAMSALTCMYLECRERLCLPSARPVWGERGPEASRCPQ